MHRSLGLLLLLPLAGCPNKNASVEQKDPGPAAQKSDTVQPYHDARPEKVKADVEAAQKKEEDRDDKILEKAKQ